MLQVLLTLYENWLLSRIGTEIDDDIQAESLCMASI